MRPDPALAGEDGTIRSEFVWAALDCPTAFACKLAAPDRARTTHGPYRQADPRRRATCRHRVAHRQRRAQAPLSPCHLTPSV